MCKMERDQLVDLKNIDQLNRRRQTVKQEEGHDKILELDNTS